MFPCSRKYNPINIKGPGPMDFQLRTVIYELKDTKFPPNVEVTKESQVGCACCAQETVNIQVCLAVVHLLSRKEECNLSHSLSAMPSSAAGSHATWDATCTKTHILHALSRVIK